MSRKLLSLGFRVQVFDPYIDQEAAREIGVAVADLDTVIRESDVVCLQCPYTPETHHIMNESRLREMKKDSILVNCARGKLVDNRALYKP
jgi:D-3-phosphoglycerate dehydrogenase